MQKVLQVSLLLVLLGSAAISQDEPQPMRELVRPADSIQVTSKLIFVFDCSTSMGEDQRFAKGMANLNMILRQPIDSGMFSMIGFNSSSYSDLQRHNFHVWKGVKEKKIPPGWASLPSKDNVDKATKWLDKIRCHEWTDVYGAIKKAFDLNKDKDSLTIILFSDGNNTWPDWKGEKPESLRKRIDQLQAARVKAGKGKIIIFVFGVGINQNVLLLSEVAKAGSGGYYTNSKLCKQCLANKTPVAEIQREHEDKHK